MQLKDPALMQLLGISRADRGVRLDDFIRDVTGTAAGAGDAAQRLFVRDLLRARGHEAAETTLEPGNERRFVVAGAVDRDGAVEGLEVVVTRHALGDGGTLLARTKTNASGEFSVAFEADAPPVVRIMIRDGRQRLYVSPPRRAERVNWVEWTATGAPVPRPGAFELRETLLEKALAPSGRPLDTLEESVEKAEISLLAESSGLSRGHVALHALGARLEKRLGVPRPVLFALLARSLTTTAWTPPPARTAIVPWDGGLGPDAIKQLQADAREGRLEARVIEMAERLVLGTDAPALQSAVAAAIHAGQVSPRVERDIKAATANLERGRVQAALSGRPGPRSTWGEILQAAGVPPQQVEAAAAALLQHPPGEPLISALVADLPENRRGAAADALRLAALVDHDAPTVQALLDARIADGRALASLEARRLDRTLETALRGRPDAAAAKARIVERLDTQYPGESLLRRRRDKIANHTIQFVEGRGAGFDLLRFNVDGAVQNGTLGRRVPEAKQVRNDLLTLQRMGRLARNAAIAEGLLERKFDSAASIAFTDRTKFLEDAKGLGSPIELERVHRRARAHYRATQALFLEMNGTANGPNALVMTSQSAMVTAAAIQGAPTWEFLFGSPDFCDCEHCASVTSPAAYLVDLLLWLQRAPGGAPRPYDVLVERRPDLVKVLLNCANTMTLVPYIDLVCELLEEAVAIREDARLNPGAPLLTAQVLAARRRARQTKLTADEIRAYPEHLDTSVYRNTLSQFANAMVAPFDLAAAEVRAYLALRQLTRVELMRLFATGTAAERAAEALGIPPAERALIAPAASAATSAIQQAQWGFTGPTVPLEDYLRRAPSPSRPKDHLSYDELLALLSCTFANPQRANPAAAVAIELEAGVTADLCLATQRQIVRLTLDALDRQHRLLRLARRGRWTLAELDALIAAVGGGALDDAALVALAGTIEIAERTGLLAEEIVFLFADFSAAHAADPARFDGRRTLYARLFFAGTESGGAPAVFRDPAAAANVTAIAAERARISGALNVSETDLDALVSATGLTGGNISFAALSTLYRHARLSRALNLPIADFETLVSRVGNPFGSPEDMLRLVRAAQLTGGAGIAGTALAVLTGAAAVTVSDAVPLTAALTELFDATAAQLELAAGAPPARAAVLAEIAARRSWTTPVTAWLNVDSRFGAIAAALDRRAPAGQILNDLYTNPIPQATLRTLARMGVFVDALEPKADLAGALATLPGVLDTMAAPSWASVANALRFNALLASASADALVSYVGGIPDAAVSRAELATRLGDALDLDAAAIEDAWDAFFGTGAIDRNQLASGVHYERLQRCLALAADFGVSAGVLKEWAKPWPGEADAVGVRNAVRSRLPAAEWLKQSTTVQNELRERRRDALVSYLLATGGPNDPKTTGDLYGHFLIDVEMDDCMNTSRIVQANAAVQLFVQRCLLGLEAIARDQLGSAHWKQWDWRQRYRLWEANRLVFLYPENFLNVARRSNASPLFVDFMKEVQQSETADENVRQALDGYLAGLERIANLDYAAIATNLDGDPGAVRELHVVGRTRGTPQKHYHRRMGGGIWTPWEELSVGTPGRHLALSHRGGTTALLWPTFADHPDPRQELPPAAEAPEAEAPPPSGISYLSYGWITRDRKRWTEVQTSERALLHRQRPRRAFLTTIGGGPSGLNLGVYAPKAPTSASDASAPLTTPHLGLMRLERDIVSISANHTQRQLPEWVGGDHQVHIDATATLAPVTISFPDCSCSMFTDSSVQPWSGLAFVDNRMIASLQTTRLDVPLETATPYARATQRVMSGRGFSVTFDAGDMRIALLQTSGSGFFQYKSYLVTNTTHDPSTDAFAITDEQRSFLCLSSASLAALAPTFTAPAGAKLLLMPAYHPYATELRAVVRRYNDGLERMFTARTQEDPSTLGRAPVVFATTYGNNAPAVAFQSSREELEFDSLNPYALYNWELFLHAPLFVAEQLRLGLRYEEARRYYHFIFTPYTSEPEDPLRPKARYWVLKPFRASQGLADDVRQIITNGAITGVNPYTDIEDHPFDAHRVAQTRPSAYQKHVLMRYLDNVVAWGDSLYRRGQREDVYEAIQHYVIAQSLLGERPQQLRPLGVRRDLAYEDEQWGGGANALVDLENLIDDAGEEPEEAEDAPLVELPLVPGLYFCVPPNQRLLGYWDEIERRLYNLRHCLTIDGRPVEYDLLAAPIDPQALVDAAAAGVSVAEALSMAGNLLPPYRFRVIWGKAQEACAEVKALGSALLSALEKRDAEHVAALRSAWEGKVLEKTRRTRQLQRDQAAAEVETLEQAKRTVEGRQRYYSSREVMNDLEKAALGLNTAAAALDVTGFVFDVLGGVLYLIPNVDLGVSGFGGTPKAGATIGGDNAGNSAERTSQGLSRMAGLLDRASGMVSTQASYVRRKDDWDHQADQARLELEHLDRQIAAARLRVAIADAEIRGHETQERSWEALDAVMREKFSNEERYDWMVETLRGLYQQAFQQSLKLARTARECLGFEMRPGTIIPPIGQNHWESLEHGLMAGERLSGDLRELDITFATRHAYDHVVTQNIPLSHVAPQALLTLRRTGQCAFNIPRWWFQRFNPALANRRVRTLAVSVPGVVGPFVGINATLRLQGAHRTLSSIALSTGINDLGMDVSSATDQYLPFEGLGLDAQTSWTFGFPPDPADPARVLTDVDYSTISDVVLHFQYTADSAAPQLDGPPQLLAFVDLRQMDADAWASLVASPAHQCTIVVADLVPTFLADYTVSAIVDSAALLDDGTVVTGRLTFTLGAGATAGQVTIALAAGQAMDWNRLSKVFIAVRMA